MKKMMARLVVVGFALAVLAVFVAIVSGTSGWLDRFEQGWTRAHTPEALHQAAHMEPEWGMGKLFGVTLVVVVGGILVFAGIARALDKIKRDVKQNLKGSR